jgi:hypothetical protein
LGLIIDCRCNTATDFAEAKKLQGEEQVKVVFRKTKRGMILSPLETAREIVKDKKWGYFCLSKDKNRLAHFYVAKFRGGENRRA